MQLLINTTLNNEIEIKLMKNKKLYSKLNVKAFKKQAELLLLSIDKLLLRNKLSIFDIDMIVVENSGGSFTSLRIGVITANTLAYALKIPVQALNNSKDNYFKYKNKKFVLPVYHSDPNIG